MHCNEETKVRVVTTLSGKQAVVSRKFDETFTLNMNKNLKLLEAKCASAVLDS